MFQNSSHYKIQLLLYIIPQLIIYMYLYAEFQNLTLRFLLVQGLTLTRYFLQSLSSLALWVSGAAVEDILFDTRKKSYTLLYEKL